MMDSEMVFMMGDTKHSSKKNPTCQVTVAPHGSGEGC